MTKAPGLVVVGMHYRGAEAKQIVGEADVGHSFILKREPNNEYDSNAIKVLEDLGDGATAHVGYIERGQAAFIAGAMDAEPEAEWRGIVTGHEQRNRNVHAILTATNEERE